MCLNMVRWRFGGLVGSEQAQGGEDDESRNDSGDDLCGTWPVTRARPHATYAICHGRTSPSVTVVGARRGVITSFDRHPRLFPEARGGLTVSDRTVSVSSSYAGGVVPYENSFLRGTSGAPTQARAKERRPAAS